MHEIIANYMTITYKHIKLKQNWLIVILCV